MRIKEETIKNGVCVCVFFFKVSTRYDRPKCTFIWYCLIHVVSVIKSAKIMNIKCFKTTKKNWHAESNDKCAREKQNKNVSKQNTVCFWWCYYLCEALKIEFL